LIVAIQKHLEKNKPEKTAVLKTNDRPERSGLSREAEFY
jgi:hypothetical protein